MTSPTLAPSKPFLLLATRPEDDAADGEYSSFLTLSGLAPDDLIRVRLEQQPLAKALPSWSLDDYSGILLGGGPFNASQPAKSELQLRIEADLRQVIAEVIARDFPFLGCCYGIGTLGAYLGATIDSSYPEPVMPTTIERTESEDPLLEGLPERFGAYVGHKECCPVVPPGAVLLATSAACPVQMFRYRSNIYATQFHPELDAAATCQRIDIYRDAGYFPIDEAESLKAAVRAAEADESSLILRRFVELYRR